MGTNYLQTNQSPPKQESTSWPHKPAEPKKYYGITDQHGHKIVAMREETWVEVGTMIESLQRKLAEAVNGGKRQHEALYHLQNANKALAAQLADLEGKHKNLRRAYRKSKHAELKDFVDDTPPPAPTTFNPL